MNALIKGAALVTIVLFSYWAGRRVTKSPDSGVISACVVGFCGVALAGDWS